MKVVVGSPGTWSGLLLRTGQCVFAGASIGVMVSALGFSNYTAFCYLIASMGLQVLWSLGLACLDVYALKIKRDLHNPVLVSLFVVGDWVTATLSLAAACSSAGVTVLFARDVHFCRTIPQFSCGRWFQILHLVITRVAPDVGCGVASFGAVLLSCNVSTTSIAPKDVHENQIQFALEHGVSALVAGFTTHWLPYPSQAFDLIHRSRCRTNSTRDGATFRASHAHVRDSRSAWKIF